MNTTSASSYTAVAEARVGPSDHNEVEARDDRGRRCYHPALTPPPPRPHGFNSTSWKVLLWIAVIALVVCPFPVW